MKKAVLCLFLLGGCVAPTTSAEIAAYNVIAPAHRAYVEADPVLTPAEKQRRYDLIDAWGSAVGAKK